MFIMQVLLRAAIVLTLFLCGVCAPQATSQVQEFAPGIVSNGHGFTVTFSLDGQDVYFTSREEGSAGSKPRLHIFRSHLSQGAWQPAKTVSFSSSDWSDLDPFITVDGRQMYFVSTRPAPGKDPATPDMDIWVSELRDGDWAEPRWIEGVNSTGKEGAPSVDRRGNLYFFSDRGNEPGHNAIYVSRWRNGRFSAPEKLPEPVNAGPSNTSPWIFPGGKVLLFYSTRSGGYGEADLYVSFLKHGKWSNPQNLGPVVNTKEYEYNPSMSRDGRTLYFGRNGKTYFVPVDALHVPALTDQHL